MEKTAIQLLQERLLKDIDIFPQYKEYIDGILYDIYNELEEIEKQQIINGNWISIKNEFPAKNQRFLGYNGNLAIYINSKKQVFKIWEITHWMPLPNKPL